MNTKINYQMWHPIENAPNDLDQIILYCGEFTCIGRWNEYYKEWEDDQGIGKLRIQPSHWMPIPEPPKEKLDEDYYKIATARIETAK